MTGNIDYREIKVDYREIKVEDILKEAKFKQPPAKVFGDSTLKEAIDALIDNETTRKVYVVDEDDKLLGTITLELLMRHTGYMLGVRKSGVKSFLKKIGEITEDYAKEIMTGDIRVQKNDTLIEVTRLMLQYHLNDLPIVDENGKLIGELNGLDILKISRKYWPQS